MIKNNISTYPLYNIPFIETSKYTTTYAHRHNLVVHDFSCYTRFMDCTNNDIVRRLVNAKLDFLITASKLKLLYIAIKNIII